MLFRFSNINKKAVVFHLNLSSLVEYEQRIVVVGFDPAVVNRVYFMRDIFLPAKAKNVKFRLPAPLTSKAVDILIFNTDEGQSNTSKYFKVSNLHTKSLKKSPIFEYDLINKYLNFILPFCYNYEFKKLGWHKSKCGNFEFNNVERINGDLTPAMINKDDNHVVISKFVFLDTPLPRKIMILLHEFSHNFLNKDMNNEIEADTNALKCYLPLQFPVIEAVYSYTKILGDDADSSERVENMMNILEKYNSKNTFKNTDDKVSNYINILANG